jgi:hypothetical protein
VSLSIAMLGFPAFRQAAGLPCARGARNPA